MRDHGISMRDSRTVSSGRVVTELAALVEYECDDERVVLVPDVRDLGMQLARDACEFDAQERVGRDPADGARSGAGAAVRAVGWSARTPLWTAAANSIIASVRIGRPG